MERLKISNGNKSKVVDLVNSFIKNNGGKYSDWHISICRDQQEVLTYIRNIKDDLWMYMFVNSTDDVHRVLKLAEERGISVSKQSSGSDANIICTYNKGANRAHFPDKF